MTIEEKKQALDQVNLEYSRHAAQLGQKTWLINKYSKEIPLHQDAMDELDAKAGKIRIEMEKMKDV